jgi:hypothetical protein
MESSIKNLKLELPCNPTLPFLEIYLKEYVPGHKRATCTPMFIAALFTIARLWKKPRCPTNDENEFKNVIYTQDGVLFSHEE